MSELNREIDKNDVDITQLFKWNKQVEIVDPVSGKKVTLYMRLVGDADLNKARVHGYRKSSQLRRKLKDKDSDERVMMLAELEDISDPRVLVPTIEVLRTQDIVQEVMKGMDMEEPKEPVAEDLEAWEEYQKAVDEYPQKFREELNKRTDEARKKDMEELEKRPTNELYKVYESEVISRLSQEEMNNSFYDMCVYLACYKDERFKTPIFKSFEDYDNIHSNLKAKLKEEYRSLELGIDTLKKYPEATV